MGTIPQKFTSDDKDIMKTLDKMHRKMVLLEQDNKKLARESEKASKKGKGGFDGMIVGAAKAATGMLSVASAVRVVNAELRNKIELDKRAAGTAMDVSGGQAAVIKNLGDVDDATAKQFLVSMRQLKSKAGFQSETPLLQAASSILSASGGDRKKTYDILSAAAPLFKDKQDDLATFGGAMGDMMKSTGSTDAKQTAALMLAIQGQARFEDLSAFQNVAPAIASAGVNDTSGNKLRATREAAALFAGIGQRAGDKEGAVTKTAVANLASNLARLVPEKDTAFERLAVVQKDAKLQEEVLRSGFKGSIKPIIKELVSGADSQTARGVQGAFAKIQGSEAAYDRKVSQLATVTKELETTNTARSSQAVAENLRLANKAGAEVATIREATYQAMKESGASTFEQTYWKLQRAGDVMIPGEQTAQDAARRGIQALRSRQGGLLGASDPEALLEGSSDADILARDTGAGGRSVTALDVKRARLLERQVEILEEIRDRKPAAPLDPNRHIE
jgi:hypothetical protein